MSAGADPGRRRGGCLLLLATLAVCFLALEGGCLVYVRAFAPAGYVAKYARDWDLPAERHQFRPHPYLGYCLNEAYRSADGLDRHNALGFRGAELSRAKPAGVYRIACLGGSSTYTSAVKDWRLSFPDRLQEVLRGRYGREEVEVINAGVPGYTSWESLINLQLRVLDLAPDLIVVYHGTNDVHARLVPPDRYRRDGTGSRKPWDPGYRWWDRSAFLHYVGIRLDLSRRNELIHRTRLAYPEEAANATAWLDANPPVYFEENLSEMVALARRHGARLVMATWAHNPGKNDYAALPYYERGFEENNEAIRRVAAREDAPVYDFAAEMPLEDRYWADGRHVTEEGARVKAELFAAFIDAEMSRAGRAAP